MAIADEIADGLSELETDFPATFIWAGSTWDCLAGSEQRGFDTTSFGLEATDSLTLIVQLAQFGTGEKPYERDKVNFNSRDYSIESIEKAPQDAFVVYRLEQHKGMERL